MNKYQKTGIVLYDFFFSQFRSTFYNFLIPTRGTINSNNYDEKLNKYYKK